jgi:hypothetical protein
MANCDYRVNRSSVILALLAGLGLGNAYAEENASNPLAAVKNTDIRL